MEVRKGSVDILVYPKPYGWYGAYSESLIGEYLPAAFPSVVADSKAVELALGNFLSNAGEALSPFKGMVFLGELKETLQMLKRPASALRNGITEYLKRSRRRLNKGGKAKIIARAISGLWLEYVYGWEPLLADIRSAAEAYRSFESKQDTARISGVATRTSKTLSEVRGNMPSYMNWIDSSVHENVSRCSFRGEIVLRPSGIQTTFAEEVIRLSGFSLAEFVPTAWELLPYSFVVDYFSNIGDILNSFHGLGSTWIWTTKATTSTATLTVTRSRDYALDATYGSAWFGPDSRWKFTPSRVSKTDYIRQANPALRLPSLVLELPPTGFTWANLLALMTSKVAQGR